MAKPNTVTNSEEAILRTDGIKRALYKILLYYSILDCKYLKKKLMNPAVEIANRWLW